MVEELVEGWNIGKKADGQSVELAGRLPVSGEAGRNKEDEV